MTMEETYSKGRGMEMTKFWEEMCLESDIKSLLCEAYVKRVGGGERSTPLFLAGVEEQLSSNSSEGDQEVLAILDEEMEIDPPTASTSTDPSRPSSPPGEDSQEVQIPVSPDLGPCLPCPEVGNAAAAAEDPVQLCCSLCPCAKMSRGVSSSQGKNSDEYSPSNLVPPPTLTRSHDSTDKESKRVHQVALILRNLSFEDDNAQVMAENVTMLR